MGSSLEFHPAGSAGRTRLEDPAFAAGRGLRWSPPRPSSFADRAHEHEPAESLTIPEDEPSRRIVVVPDLELRRIGGRSPRLDLIRRPIPDVDPAHVGSP